MNRIYRYVLAQDGGMAPNPRGSFLSLATCKPVIRSTANNDDWVIGCFPAPQNDRVAWAGRVEKCLAIGEYAATYPARDDALYSQGEDGLLTRIIGKHDLYHPDPDQRRKDMKGRVLVFDSNLTWYFGDDGKCLPSHLAHLTPRGQGHRVNARRENDLEQLLHWLKSLSGPMLNGTPRHGWYKLGSPGCKKPRRKKQGC